MVFFHSFDQDLLRWHLNCDLGKLIFGHVDVLGYYFVPLNHLRLHYCASLFNLFIKNLAAARVLDDPPFLLPLNALNFGFPDCDTSTAAMTLDYEEAGNKAFKLFFHASSYEPHTHESLNLCDESDCAIIFLGNRIFANGYSHNRVCLLIDIDSKVQV